MAGTSWNPDHPLVGRVLDGRFRIASFIREGGMAQVFSAEQSNEPRHVAIKVVHPELADDPEIVRRFMREARVAELLHHPNIVRILAVGEDDGLLYMAMELLFGDDLSARVKVGTSFAEARATEIMIDVCSALQHAHAAGVVHRDVKPENIMLCRQPTDPQREIVKVLDFGIAKVLDARPDVELPEDAPTSRRSVLTRVGTWVGTPAYMSPEQGRAEVIDHRSDIYSVGVLLYELICGRLPFEGETPLQVIARHVQEAPPPPSTFASVHPDLERIILRALAKEPNDRHASAAELASDLSRVLPDLSVSSNQIWELDRPDGGLRSPRRSSRPPGLAGAALKAPELKADHHPLIGSFLAEKYQVASFIREGSMAHIFCGLSDQPPHHVAIKVVHPKLASDLDFAERFLKEGRAAAKLNHSNIVRVLDVGMEDDLVFMVMELLYGDDLSARIKQHAAFTQERAVEIAVEICRALAHAHEQGVVHRDVRPENVMLCRLPNDPTREVVKVLDFGMAKVLDGKKDLPQSDLRMSMRATLTRVGDLVGTPTYTSPEQGKGEPIDHRADIYAVGVLLYELLCGKPPFHGDSPLQIVVRHISETPLAPSKLVPMSGRLEAIVLRALAKKPADRFQSATELADALDGLRTQSETAATKGAAGSRWAGRTGMGVAFAPTTRSVAVLPAPPPPAAASGPGTPASLLPAEQLPAGEPLPHVDPSPAREPSSPGEAQRISSLGPRPPLRAATVAPPEAAGSDARIERLTRLVTLLAIMLGVALLAIGLLFWSSLG